MSGAIEIRQNDTHSLAFTGDEEKAGMAAIAESSSRPMSGAQTGTSYGKISFTMTLPPTTLPLLPQRRRGWKLTRSRMKTPTEKRAGQVPNEVYLIVSCMFMLVLIGQLFAMQVFESRRPIPRNVNVNYGVR